MNSLKTLVEVPTYALSRPNGHEIVSPSFTSSECEEIVAYCSKCESEISAVYFNYEKNCGGYWSSFRSSLSATNKNGACA